MKGMILCMFVVLLLAAVSNMDYSDAINEQVSYCNMVTQGHWPNYKGITCQ